MEPTRGAAGSSKVLNLQRIWPMPRDRGGANVACPSGHIIPLGRRQWPLIVLAVILAMFAMPQLSERVAAQTSDAPLRTGGAVLQAGNADLLTRVTLVKG